MSALTAPVGSVQPRLLAGIRASGAVPLTDHLRLYGSIRDVLPQGGENLIGLIEASGLTGRGGGGFPTGRKLRSVAEQRRQPIVVVNGLEGEPMSGKDKLLLRHLPHLVLDGAVAAATAVGAKEAVIAVARGARHERAGVARALDERERHGGDGRVSLRLAVVPDGFISGEESALIHSLNGGAAKPTFTPPRPYERGVGGVPTLVQNIETVAHLALIARFGATWFRESGTADEPGSTLVTIGGAVRRPGVYEFGLGTSFPAIVVEAGGVTEAPRAFLVGGYFGTWANADEIARLSLLDSDLRTVGAALGARSIVVFPGSACGVAESARVARFLADEGAGQCGPCVNGLAAIAGGLERLARLEKGDPRGDLARWVELVRGRGACHHPDGAARFVSSMFTVFNDEVEHHLRRRGCSRTSRRVLPLTTRVRARL
jgi:NADH:ubiquinone oxidoreductase subunit F (NADH-binding)